MNTTKIMFKGDKLGLKIIIDKELPFNEVKEVLTKKAIASKGIFGNTSCGITFMGRELSDDETKILVDILTRECALEVNFTVNEMYVKKYMQKESILSDLKKNEWTSSISSLSNQIPDMKKIEEKVEKMFSENENSTIFHKGSLRSGASIKHNGSIVVLGDVNAGAEIIAEGNVLILGNVKGLIQAGCSGNKRCFVFALNLLPIQLRIGEIIAFLPKEEKRAKGLYKPQVAYVDDDKIFISEI